VESAFRPRIALSADPSDTNTLSQVRAAIQAGLTDIAQKTGALSTNGSGSESQNLLTTKRRELLGDARGVG